MQASLLSQIRHHVESTRLFSSCQRHQGKPVPIELSIATFHSDGSDPQVMGISVNHGVLTSTPHELRSNSPEHEPLFLVHSSLPKSIPVEYLSFCVRGNRRGLMVDKGTEQQKFFQDLGVFAMSLETLPKFNDIYYGTVPNSLHKEVHETVSYCRMVKYYQLDKYLQQFNTLQVEWSHKVSSL
ncbi:hypothetical protein TNCV_4310831 [Trichonephila clavipes]|nr:hypothetical protein TNCV_4310831 [Trichonephila clavipes]